MKANRLNFPCAQPMHSENDLVIGGFQPFTLSDFPGRPAAIVFTQGCNFRCPFCHNGALIPMDAPADQLVAVDSVLSTLAKRIGRLGGLVITGGEPTLQEGLAGFIREVRSMGFSIKLDTNGSRPWILKRLINEGLLDFIAMDIKAPPERYSSLSGCPVDFDLIAKSINLIAKSQVEHLFRTTFVNALLNGDDIAAIRRLIPENSRYITQPFLAEHALDQGLR